jgi:hypothetical protein
MGLDPVFAMPTQKRFKGAGLGPDGEQYDFFLIMKKVIHMDRMRRKAVMEGKLRDIEHLGKFNEEMLFGGVRRSNDPSIVTNGV